LRADWAFAQKIQGASFAAEIERSDEKKAIRVSARLKV
jgi:hypothetical protein